MDNYSTLGIKKGASKDEIRKAYLKMALLNHPDRHLEKKEYYTIEFQKISRAYDNLYNTNLNTKFNPYDVFKNFFPKNINLDKNTLNIISELYQKIIENNYNFNILLFFEMIELVNRPNFKKKINDYFDDSLSIKLTNKKADTLIINKEIDLKTQYISNIYEIELNLKKRSKCRFPKLINYKKKININLLNNKNILMCSGNYNLKDKYQGDIEINIIDKNDICFKRYKDFDLIYTLYLSKEDFCNEIYHIIPHFEDNLHIYINNPYQNYLYKIKNYGMIDYSDKYRGDLYIIIKIDLKLNKSNLFFNDYLTIETVNMF